MPMNDSVKKTEYLWTLKTIGLTVGAIQSSSVKPCHNLDAISTKSHFSPPCLLARMHTVALPINRG